MEKGRKRPPMRTALGWETANKGSQHHHSSEFFDAALENDVDGGAVGGFQDNVDGPGEKEVSGAFSSLLLLAR